jgi:hypothetical protein
MVDSKGCVTGWRCANGADPCVTQPCTSEPCPAGQACGSDLLCWPSGSGGDGGGSGTGGAGGGAGGTSGSAGGAAGSSDTYVPFCGAKDGVSCGAKEYCEKTAKACEAPDGAGFCKPRPESCSGDYVPVCGCDGTTYSNDCIRELAGMSKMDDGACAGGTGGAGGSGDAGLSGPLAVKPNGVSFTQGIGVTSRPISVTLQNGGSATSGAITVTITGPNASVFLITGITCVGTLAAGKTCEVEVVFKAPSTSATYTATLNITVAGSSGGVLAVSLSGNASPAPSTSIDAGPT